MQFSKNFHAKISMEAAAILINSETGRIVLLLITTKQMRSNELNAQSKRRKNVLFLYFDHRLLPSARHLEEMIITFSSYGYFSSNITT